MRCATYVAIIVSSLLLYPLTHQAQEHNPPQEDTALIDIGVVGIGVVNFQEVLTQSTAWQDFKIKITDATKKFEANINKMADEIEQKENDLKKKSKHLSQTARKQTQSELIELQARYSKQLQEQKNKLDRDYVTTQDYLRQRIYAILRRISTEKKLSLVLNAGTTTNAVLVANKKLDITVQALEMLNQELPQLDEDFFRNLQLQN